MKGALRKREVAAFIMSCLSRNPGGAGHIPADQLALILLLEDHGPATIVEIRDFLHMSQASASALAERAENENRVRRVVGADRRFTIVRLTSKAFREAERSPGGRRALDPVAEEGERLAEGLNRPQNSRGPLPGVLRRVVTSGLCIGDNDVLECGHLFQIDRKTTKRHAKRRRCVECETEGDHADAESAVSMGDPNGETAPDRQ